MIQGCKLDTQKPIGSSTITNTPTTDNSPEPEPEPEPLPEPEIEEATLSMSARYVHLQDTNDVSGTISLDLNVWTSKIVDQTTVYYTLDQNTKMQAKDPTPLALNTRTLSPGNHILEAKVVGQKNDETVEQILSPIQLNVASTPYTEIPQFNPIRNVNMPNRHGNFENKTTKIEITEGRDILINGTPNDDDVFVSQINNSIIIQTESDSQMFTGVFNNLIIKGWGGDDWITVDDSVQLYARAYAGEGNNIIENYAQHGEIISIGSGQNYIEGNGYNTNYWVNGANQDMVYASDFELSRNYVHRVDSFYQPWSTNPQNQDYISKILIGQKLKDPTDQGGENIWSNANSLFAFDPSVFDVNQRFIGDCYFLAAIQSIANQSPSTIRNLIADLGDGTYVVKFKSDYVRVDGDFANWAASPGSSGNLWPIVFEKAYAFYRYKSSTYRSLDYGWSYEVFNNLTLTYASQALSWQTSAAWLYDTVLDKLKSNQAVTIATNYYSSAPFVNNHMYSIIGVFKDTDGQVKYVLRNPWGYDGNDYVDRASNDGIVIVTSSALINNTRQLEWTTGIIPRLDK